jgi:hypothetical protein
MSVPAPQLQNVSTIEVASQATASVTFLMNFDSSFTTNNNVFQIEAWVYDESAPLVALNENRFIAVENPNSMSESGITNQTVFSIPEITDIEYNNTTKYVKARVYSSSTSTGEISVSQFSNSVPFHNSPPQPVISHAFLLGRDETYSNTDELYVQLSNSVSDYNLNDIQFFVSYYYTDETDTPQWIVSDLVSASFLGDKICLDAVQFPSGEDARYPLQDVKVAVNAVYIFENASLSYSSVSQISTTVDAENAGYLPPTDLEAVYNIYNESSQTITLTWQPPSDSTIPNYNVQSYRIYVNSVLVDTIDAEVEPTYVYTIVDGECGLAYEFYVTAVFASGNVSDPSNSVSVNYFEYPSAPTSMYVVWCNQGDYQTTVDMLVTWTNPTTSGCCKPGETRQFVIEVYNDNSDLRATYNQAYDPDATSYAKYLNEIETSNTGNVIVYLQTVDTNSPYGNRNGPSVSSVYSVDELPFIYDEIINPAQNRLTFKVLTSTPLAYVAQFTYFDTVLTTQAYYTNPDTEYVNQTVTMTPDYEGTGDYLYEFTIEGALFSEHELLIPDSLIISVANNYGIGVKPATVI